VKTVCIIPARGGSVRIPGKNIKPFHGKPIIEYSIETAQRSMLFDDIIVSTDDAEIARIARKAGASVFWRKGTDDGTKGTQEVAADVLREKPAGLACVLYATAPLLNAWHLIGAYRRLVAHPNALSFVYSVDWRSVDIGGYYWGWGAAFVAGDDLQRRGTPVVLEEKYCCDINTPEDWARAESMYDALRRATP
jgi:pseudaminic acid cytidylyltransferase